MIFSPTIILAIALALSVLGNVFLGNAYLNQRDSATVSKVEAREVTAVATACSQGTEALDTKAKENKVAGAVKTASAAAAAASHDKRADEILTTPPATPGNACGSAEALVDDWWKGRKP